jgi:hypothetical protein
MRIACPIFCLALEVKCEAEKKLKQPTLYEPEIVYFRLIFFIFSIKARSVSTDWAFFFGYCEFNEIPLPCKVSTMLCK